MKNQICQECVLHSDNIEYVKHNIENEETILEVSDLFKVFADSTRLKILSALFLKELCVCDISNLLNMSLSAISHQLKILRQSKLVKFKKVGKEVFYSLADNHVYQILNMAIEHIKE